MWLINAAKSGYNCARSKFVTRMIRSEGNGQRRFIVKGFDGPNLDAKTHFVWLEILKKFNHRPVVTGFTSNLPPKKIMTVPLSSPPDRALTRFFAGFNTPQLSRHVVHDIKPPRTVVQGFCTEAKSAVAVSDTVIKPVKLPSCNELMAKERIVVQGFTSNPSSTPVKKTMDTTPATERVVVQGFTSNPSTTPVKKVMDTTPATDSLHNKIGFV